MGDSRIDVPPARRRAPARGEIPEASEARAIPAGVSNHLLARVFQYKGTTYDRENSAKPPKIHGAKPGDLTKLAADDRDYGELGTKAKVDEAMVAYAAGHRAAAVATPLDAIYTGNRTVLDDVELDHASGPVRATFQLDAMQGKHDVEFASGKDARKKKGGEKMPEGTDYAALAGVVPLELTTARLDDIFAKGERQALNFSVQKTVQGDGFQYEISAMWATTDEGRHVLVFYHCYPPR
jgi:hypothetical protein